MTVPRSLVDQCPRCRRRHLVGLPCWRGAYVARITRAVLTTQGDTCWLCGRAGASTVDHVVPRSQGGTDALSNLRPAHQRCNSRRGNGAPFTVDPPARPAGVGLSSRWRATG